MHKTKQDTKSASKVVPIICLTAGVLADLVRLRGFGPAQTIPFLNGLLELFQFIKQFRYSSGHFHNFSKHLCDKVDATNRSCPYISKWKCNFLQYSVNNSNTQIKTLY